MTGWREELAKNIHKNNPELTARQLNEVVQRLLDRIVFIRIAEDRKVLEYGQLRRVLEDWEIHGGKFHIFDWLNDLFHKVNEDSTAKSSNRTFRRPSRLIPSCWRGSSSGCIRPKALTGLT